MEQKHRLPGACSAGCSAIAWETADGRHLFGRNFDYNRVAADSKVTCFPPGTELCTRGTGLDDSRDPAARRRADYGAVGMGTTVLGATPVLYEGLNERGLMGAQLYYRGYARYPDRPAGGRLPLQPPFLVTLCLACCATVEEAARLLTEEVSLVGEPLLGTVPPLHWMFSDPTGESLVVEPDGDGLHLYRNTVGVMTNSPPYPWHRANLLNYAHLRPLDYGARDWGGERLEPCFSGTGAAGLPGGWSSPARFVRLAFLRQCAGKGRDEAEGVALLFRLLHSAAFPLGAVELTEVEAETGYDREEVPYDYTVYSSVQCAESGRFYWLTYRNTCPRFVELPRLLEHNRVLQFPLETAPEFRDVTEYAE